MRGSGRSGGVRPTASNEGDDRLLEHVEHVLARGERELEVELRNSNWRSARRSSSRQQVAIW